MIAQDRAPYLYRCRQGGIMCSPLGHRTRAAAERCTERRNRNLRALGLWSRESAWVVVPLEAP